MTNAVAMCVPKTNKNERISVYQRTHPWTPKKFHNYDTPLNTDRSFRVSNECIRVRYDLLTITINIQAL